MKIQFCSEKQERLLCCFQVSKSSQIPCHLNQFSLFLQRYFVKVWDLNFLFLLILQEYRSHRRRLLEGRIHRFIQVLFCFYRWFNLTLKLYQLPVRHLLLKYGY